MSYIAKVGFRTYEFESFEDLTKAREIYAACTADQDDFETEMDNFGVQYCYDV